MSSDQHGRESDTTAQQKSLENQKQVIVEKEEEDDILAEFSFVTGHDVDRYSSDENNENSAENSDTDANTLQLVSIFSDATPQKSSQKLPHRGAPKMKKQKRVSHLYTELVYSAKSREDLFERKKNLDFVLKKTSNNSKLTYYKCITHKNCSYSELVRKGDAGSGFHSHVFTKIDSRHSQEFARQSTTNGISERWIRTVDTLIESGRRPMQIRTHLLLLANKSSDKLLAVKSLPTKKQLSSRKRVLVNKKRGRWNLQVNADLINFYRSSFIQTRQQFDAVKVRQMFSMHCHAQILN